MKKKVNLDKEEKKILAAYDNDEYKTSDKINDLKQQFRSAAVNMNAKNANINLRLSAGDLQKVKQKADESGIPYQTLLGALIHQFAEGKIKISI